MTVLIDLHHVLNNCWCYDRPPFYNSHLKRSSLAFSFFFFFFFLKLMVFVGLFVCFFMSFVVFDSKLPRILWFRNSLPNLSKYACSIMNYNFFFRAQLKPLSYGYRYVTGVLRGEDRITQNCKLSLISLLSKSFCRINTFFQCWYVFLKYIFPNFQSVQKAANKLSKYVVRLLAQMMPSKHRPQGKLKINFIVRI